LMHSGNYFGMMMMEQKEADAFIAGYATNYSDAVRPLIEVINCTKKLENIAGMYIVHTKQRNLFFADTTINIRPDVKSLVDTTIMVANAVKALGEEPVIAMVSYSNFGAGKGESPEVVRKAVEILHKEYPKIIVDGEMQANFALNTELRDKHYPFSKIKGLKVNTLVFPNLSSANIAYKMMQEIGGAEVTGPILCGIGRPAHVVQLGSSVREIVNMTAIAVVDAQNSK